MGKCVCPTINIEQFGKGIQKIYRYFQLKSQNIYKHH